MDGLQFAVERVRVRRRQGPADNTDQALEAGRAHVQQVSPFDSIQLRPARPFDRFLCRALGPCLIQFSTTTGLLIRH